jgi:hypothetical protein
MHEAPCRFLGELRYPEDYPFARVVAIESEAGPILEEALAGLAVSHLEVSPGPDSLRFEGWCEVCDAEAAAALCAALLPLMDDGPLGRLIVVREAQEPISVVYFSGETIDEVTVEQP